MQRLTTEQAVTVSAYTGFLVCNFSDLHEAIQVKLGRPVFTHELGNKEFLEQIRETFRGDFLALAPEPENTVLEMNYD